MNMLYDSDSFVVVHFQSEMPAANDVTGLGVGIVIDGSNPTVPAAQEEPLKPRLARNGFEIVDKRSGREIYLDGSWAEMFQQHITAWQQNTPTQEEVEDTLDRYASLAQQPVTVH
jgi:hypothetical protein